MSEKPSSSAAVSQIKSALISIVTLLVMLAITATIAALSSLGMSMQFGLTVSMWALIIALGCQWLGFVHAYFYQTERYYDLVGAIANIAVVVFVLSFAEHRDLRALLLATLITLWAVRLGGFLFVRILKDGGDGRFDDIKTNFFRFLLTWTLQGVWVFFIQLCAILAISAQSTQPLDVFAIVGGIIWLLGMAIETAADWQKRRFRSQLQNKGQFISTGLWARSRHPNYFGEIVLWIGIAIVALPALSGWMYFGLLSPCFVVFLLTRVSGIPLLEARADKRWDGDADYLHYKNTTPVLILKLR
ncbi:DUF1295 domain-containing protein [Zhongshania aliphaticivorans]|uniref:DUF1295 domain-containing protein n=1 Tax=Zhongshania aliphaticivorans TaxID=1470434 RepID=UPI0012E58CBF|nr:DUF1295 domain-containing protein [Zhongshania aliphaticivorans]CAA0097383.1 Uncharacterised protein [Zhongshania aliphaticivorans]